MNVAVAGAAAVVGAVVGAELVAGAALGIAAGAAVGGAGRAVSRGVARLRAVGDWDVVAGDRLRLARREVRSLPYVVHAGDVLRWEFCVRDHDVAFRVTERAMSNGGAVELELLADAKFASGFAYGGAWTAARAMTILLVFSNEHSRFRGKELAYAVSVGSADDPPPPRAAAAPLRDDPALSAYRREWESLHPARGT